MKTSKIVLDVDVIGDQDGLTFDEEKALSAFFQQLKLANKTIKVSSKKTPKAAKFQG